ncbi:MAG: glycoside hydrolase family 13 protein [Flavobacteriaceae bacterium]|nr:glycoside hydrolase family 13 protein [Flavobacteriaceae bacterium]NVJ72625.1 glycoside hydrolase family 13 protein [Flavobacteriaceae bacterium]
MPRIKYLFSSLLFLFFSGISFAQLEQVEPPFWWEGMNRSEIQLVFYGNEIGVGDLYLDGQKVDEVIKTENENYLFYNWETKGLKAGSYLFELKKGKKRIATYAYELKKRREGSAQREGFSSQDAVYLLMPDRFANGDPSNDSTKDTYEKANVDDPWGRHGGDIQGIIKNLDYIKELGMTALWSTPLLEDNDKRGSYHGYACSDTYHIDSRYGGNSAYLKLSDELHKRDMKLIKDYVTNHWSLEHYMIKDLPSKDWIHYFDGENGYAQTNYRLSTVYDTNASKADIFLAEKGWFVPSMPDLNQSNPMTLNYLIDNAIWWIEYANLDGYRVDTYPYNEKERVTTWTKAIMAEYPNFNIVGESWYHDTASIAYWQKDSKLAEIQDFNSELPSVMDFVFFETLQRMMTYEPSWDKGLVEMYNAMGMDYLYPDINNVMIFAENHDTTRFNEKNATLGDFKIAMTLLATTRGIPQLYYGSEIGFKGDKAKGDADLRKDMPGGWPNDVRSAFNALERTSEEQSYFDIVKTLFQWRQHQELIHKGKTVHFIPLNEIYVYFRVLDQNAVMVVINANKEVQTIELSRFNELLESYSKASELFSGTQINLEKTLSIPARDAQVFELF